MPTPFRLIERFRHPLATLVEVRLSRRALVSNYEAFQNAYNLPVAPVLKSNAYGHGLVQIAKILEPLNPPLLVVDSYFEAQLLRRHGVGTPILIIGYVPIEIITQNRLRAISFVVTSIEALEVLVDSNIQARVHIKLDTGMRRQGILSSQVSAALEMLKNSSLEVEGVCSHFASADSNETFTRKQIALWNASVPMWKESFPQLRYWHIAASAGSIYASECDTNLIRLGAGLYGFEKIPSRSIPLSPVLSVHSQLTVVKEIAKGDMVGYNGTFVAEKVMRIATVPVGYFEGFNRQLSNKGSMLVMGHECPVVGRVSMNMTTIDVSKCPEAKLGTPVVVISEETEDPNSVEHLATLCGISPLELLVHIPQHLRRVVV